MKLSDLQPVMTRRREEDISYSRFRADPALATLDWPDDVLEQFLFDHGDNAPFLHDYGHLDLRHIAWRLDTFSAADFDDMPTGATDAGCIEAYAKHPVHWVTIRPPEVGRHWEERGTWMRPPLLIERCLLDPADSGLQVLEGRTRVGVLFGRLREQLRVAPTHQAWVGRPRVGQGAGV
ncbi:hypothetical protein ACFW2M_29115 [Streptomyces albidoflavus]|uniref:hypothetical protein n=1 Tax=Streptomyces albidoflavus TaxID=1886 RepID=UPI000526E322|nr:hypothetical protein [Streptomyces albidoflavus]